MKTPKKGVQFTESCGLFFFFFVFFIFLFLFLFLTMYLAPAAGKSCGQIHSVFTDVSVCVPVHLLAVFVVLIDINNVLLIMIYI